MQFSSVADFIAMGGYGFYVWLSYGVSALLLTILLLSSLAKDKKVKLNILARQKREQKLRQVAANQKQHEQQEQQEQQDQIESNENRL
jgi:heme exporter protein D